MITYYLALIAVFILSVLLGKLVQLKLRFAEEERLEYLKYVRLIEVKSRLRRDFVWK